REALGLDPRLVEDVQAFHRAAEIVRLVDPGARQLVEDIGSHAQLRWRDHEQLVAREAREQERQRASGAAMAKVSGQPDAQMIQTAELLLDGVEVEERLGGMVS